MLNLREIHKPKTLEEALDLLRQPNTVALAGGTDLIASQRQDVRAVVDLSGLDLAYIRDDDGAVAIGALTTLGAVAESPILRAAANGVVAMAAHRSAASLLRNQATVSGTLIAEPAGILATVLAAVEARVETSPPTTPPQGQRGIALSDFLARRLVYLKGAIVVQVVVPRSSLSRRAATETVARTPRDKPIVSVCAAVELDNGRVRAAAIALGGVGDVAIRADEAERELLGRQLSDEVIENAAREVMSKLDPPSDYRGSAEYRREMVKVLTTRALGSFASS